MDPFSLLYHDLENLPEMQVEVEVEVGMGGIVEMEIAVSPTQPNHKRKEPAEEKEKPKAKRSKRIQHSHKAHIREVNARGFVLPAIPPKWMQLRTREDKPLWIPKASIPVPARTSLPHGWMRQHPLMVLSNRYTHNPFPHTRVYMPVHENLPGFPFAFLLKWWNANLENPSVTGYTRSDILPTLCWIPSGFQVDAWLARMKGTFSMAFEDVQREYLQFLELDALRKQLNQQDASDSATTISNCARAEEEEEESI